MRVMHNPARSTIPKLLLIGVASATLAIGASAAASATTEPPTDTAAPGTAAPPGDGSAAPTGTEHTMDMGSAPAGSLAVDGSAEAASPEAEAFCTAEMAVEAAVGGEDPAAIGPAIEALLAAAPDDEIGATVQTVIDTFEAEGPEFEAAYADLIDYMKANCGFAELDVAASEYSFSGVPTELPAGPIIVSLENTGEELHVIDFARVNDDVTLSTDELLALPEEEVFTMVALVGGAFANPGATGYGVMDLTPGRYLAVCPIPQGLTPEVAAQFEEPAGTAPAGSAPMGSEPMGSAPAGTEPVAAETMATEPMGSEPMGSAPTGSAPGGPELGPPHFMVPEEEGGPMLVEITVV